MLQGRFWGRQLKTSSENSEKSTSYSVRMPSVSASISPACPNVFASRLKTTLRNTVIKHNCECKTHHLEDIQVTQISPFSKVVVCWPLCYSADEECVFIVSRSGRKVCRTVCQRHINSRDPMVHRREHSKILVGEKFQEA